MEMPMSQRMQWFLTAVCTVALAGSLAAKPRVRLGGVAVGASYGYGAYPYFSPFYYDPGYFTGFAYQPNMGEVKLVTPAKAGEVFLNGAYAGEVSRLRSMWLDPGAYNLEIRNGSQSLYERRIYVLTDKTLKIRVEK